MDKLSCVRCALQTTTKTIAFWIFVQVQIDKESRPNGNHFHDQLCKALTTIYKNEMSELISMMWFKLRNKINTRF